IRISGDGDPGDASDWGDAPDSYGTTSAANGAFHRFKPGLSLGDNWDGETNGQPSPRADGDDNDTSSANDEDGVLLPSEFIRGRDGDIRVFVRGEGILHAWFDFNGDGTFSRDEFVLQEEVDEGDFSFSIDVPSGSELGDSYARFRLSDRELPDPTGDGGVGEVEDYRIFLADPPPPPNRDFGDAPASYGTLLADNGPRHDRNVGFSFGDSMSGIPDVEPDGQPTADAQGDNNNGFNDERDVIHGVLAHGVTNAVLVDYNNNAGLANPRIDAWYDWNRDGDFLDPGEHVFDSLDPSTLT
ncbi:MAG: GEVED domain-containing protein, partial [Planctomycetota bacterium]